ncbi:hypothetical protein TWF730_006831 [Orbilia blumenaviensis]|uniref:Uncharacterized protein n=1 Tax=Orbilia blumenaviensis TaxID=1796055 RepID=A0AAV9VFF7_9PEZI
MEVDHDAMRQAGSATIPFSERTREASNAMEHDPSSAPQIVDPSNPPMSFRSGAVPDQYESYPEVMPPQGLTPPSAYPQSTVSPIQPGSAYDRYAISPPPAGQNQPLMQNAQYSQNPTHPEAEKSYYQPAYGVNQPIPPPTPYSNANTIVPDHNTAPSYDKVVGGTGTLPPPVAYNPPADKSEKRILGMKKKTFWIVLIVLIVLILAGIGGAVGGILAGKNKNNDNGGSGNNNNSGSDRGNSTNGDNGNGGGYTPFAITTGVRTLSLKYQQSEGSCNAPGSFGGSGVVDCLDESTLVVRVDGSVEDGYTLSSVSGGGSTFSNIQGTPPTTSDPNELGSGWVFEVVFTAGGACSTNRATRYIFGVRDDLYAVGDAYSLRQTCSKQNGDSYPTGTTCTCVAISKTAV